jgi:hypothetical protein
MSQPESKQNEPSKMKKLLNGGEADESPMARLQRSMGGNISQKKETAPKADVPKQPKTVSKPAFQPKAASKTGTGGFKFMPAFWTVASVMSFTVNIVLLIVVAIVLQNLGTVGVTVTGITDQLLGGLYNNFVRMDNATIRTQIPVNADIPLNITVPVKATTQITLAEAAVIRNAQVIINTGSLDINANATVTLPANTPLVVNLDFPLQVTDTIPISLLVDVNIPLMDTELSAPFNGLQDVVRPYYCLIKPKATSIIDNSFVCSQNP